MQPSYKIRYLCFCLFAALLVAACTAAPAPTLPDASPDPASVRPANTPTAIPPTPTAVITAQQTFAIMANRGWDSVGMFVRQGQPFEITAAGTWSDGQAEGSFGPGGADRFAPDAVLPSAPIGALVGRIGYNAPFLIGEHAVLRAPYGGELWVGINDHPEALGDNSGTLEVTVALGPRPAVPTQLLTNELDGYRLEVPTDYQAVIYENSLCLTLTGAQMMACHVANGFIDTGDAAGRTLGQVADELAAQGNPDIEVRRSSLTVSGEDAVLLDDIYGQDVMRKVVILHDDRVYTLTFVPWSEDLDDFDRLEALYNTVIGSFSFLTPPGVTEPQPAESALPATPTALELRTDSVLTSYSPDGRWKAEVLLASQYDPSYASSYLEDYVLLTVFRLDGSKTWTAYEEWSETGLGDSFVSGMYWPTGGQYLYFTHVGVMHPCGAPFVTDLHRFDLLDGSLTEIALAGLQLGNISISPGVDRMVYHTDGGLLVTELESGSSRLYPYTWPENSLPDNYAWSPDGQKLAFNFMENFCDFGGDFRSSIMILDLVSGTIQDVTGEDLPVPLILGWPEPGRLLGDRDGRGYYDLASGEFALDPSLADPVPMARWFLGNYLGSLYWGDENYLDYFNYGQAASMYGGSYEQIWGMNPAADREDRAALLRLACENNGFQCLRLREVLAAEPVPWEDGALAVRLAVNLMNPDGSVFGLGPCCGDDASAEPQTEFVFTVLTLPDGSMQVLELPPYMP